MFRPERRSGGRGAFSAVRVKRAAASESLKEYALIDPERRSADVYRKGADGLWVLHPFAAGDTVEFASVELRLPAAELFAKLD